MIALLTGQPQRLADRLILLVNGVGYAVFVGPHLLAEAITQDVLTLYIHTYVKEDRLELYGLKTPAELQLFEQVLSVSGVGPKMASALIDAGASQLIEAIQQADLSFFTAVPRVGKKLGQKIIIELKSKLGGLRELDLGPISSKQADVVATLQALGFGDQAIHAAVRQLDIENMTLEAAVKAGIKLCSQPLGVT